MTNDSGKSPSRTGVIFALGLAGGMLLYKVLVA